MWSWYLKFHPRDVFLCVFKTHYAAEREKKTPLPSLPLSPSTSTNPASWSFFSYFLRAKVDDAQAWKNRKSQQPVAVQLALPARDHFSPNIVFPQSARRHFFNGLFYGFIFTLRIYTARHIKSILTLSWLLHSRQLWQRGSARVCCPACKSRRI